MWKCKECMRETVSNNRKLNIDKIRETVEIKLKTTYNSEYTLENIGEFNGKHTEITLRCKKHNIIFVKTYRSVLSGKINCPKCLYEKRLAWLSTTEEKVLEKINNKISSLNNDGYRIKFLGFVEDDIPASYRHLRLYCEIHNIYWETTDYDSFINTAGVFCHKCSITKVGKISNKETQCFDEIKKHVSENNVNKQFEIRLDKGIKQLINHTESIRADFYIKDINAIIEYNGGQHYRFVPYIQKYYSKFVDQVNRDLYLKKYCKENNIKLLVIPYVDDKRIPEIIEKFINDGIDITTKLEPKLLPILYEETCKSLVKYG